MKTLLSVFFIFALSIAIVAPAVIDISDYGVIAELVENLNEEDHESDSGNEIEESKILFNYKMVAVTPLSELNKKHLSNRADDYHNLAHEIIIPPPDLG